MNLVVGPNNDGTISSHAEYAFAEWDCVVGSDTDALRRVFDTNYDRSLCGASDRDGESGAAC